MINRIKSSKEYINFTRLLQNNKLSHAYLIYSNSEKLNLIFCQTLAALFIDKVDYPEFHPDILLYPKEKTILVEDANDIIENASIRPMMANFKVFIISNIDKATIQAQNKLLKTIEEAGQNNIFLFNATNKNLVLQTIQSRTQMVNIDAILQDDISTLDNYPLVMDILKNMKSSSNVLNFVNKFADKKNFLQNLKILEYCLERILYFNLGLISDDELADFAFEFSQSAIGEMFKLILDARQQFDANVNVNLITDMLFLKLLEVKHYAKD